MNFLHSYSHGSAFGKLLNLNSSVSVSRVPALSARELGILLDHAPTKQSASRKTLEV